MLTQWRVLAACLRTACKTSMRVVLVCVDSVPRDDTPARWRQHRRRAAAICCPTSPETSFRTCDVTPSAESRTSKTPPRLYHYGTTTTNNNANITSQVRNARINSRILNKYLFIFQNYYKRKTLNQRGNQLVKESTKSGVSATGDFNVELCWRLFTYEKYISL